MPSTTTPAPSTSCTITAAEPCADDSKRTAIRKSCATMSLHTCAVPSVPYVTSQSWSNWGGNQTCTPAFTVYPRSEQEVLDAVRFAINQGLPVRAVGAGYSFTAIATTGGVPV